MKSKNSGTACGLRPTRKAATTRPFSRFWPGTFGNAISTNAIAFWRLRAWTELGVTEEYQSLTEYADSQMRSPGGMSL